MPDIFGNPTLQETTAQRRVDNQKFLQGYLAEQQTSSMTGSEKIGGAIGSIFGSFLGDKYRTKFADTAEGQAMAAQEAQLAGIMGKDYSNQNSNVSTPNGGITTQSTPVPEVDATRAKAKAFMDYATQTNNPEAFKYALGLEQEAITLGKAQKEAQIREGYVNTLPDDLKALAKDGSVNTTEIQKILEERNKKKDNYRILTPSEVAKEGLDPSIKYQINEKNNDIEPLDDGIKIENNYDNSSTDIGEFAKAIAKKDAEWYDEARPKVESSVDGLKSIRQARASLKSGTFLTGVTAPLELGIYKLLEAGGVASPEQLSAIKETETYMISTAKSVATFLGSGALGSGTGISEKDLKFAQDIALNNIKLSPNTIERMLGLAEKVEVTKINNYNNRISRLNKEYKTNQPYQYYDGMQRKNKDTVQVYKDGQWTDVPKAGG
jgi:hypothetical protein